jgi:Na+/H+ antiporter NhaA
VTPLGRARTVALWYVLLSAVYLLWLHDLVETPNGVVTSVATLTVANTVMAALAFLYPRLGRPLRLMTLTASLIISIFAVVAVAVFMFRHTPVSILVASGYCFCTYYLWKIGGVASNDRWTDP